MDPSQSRGAIESAFLAIEGNMLDAIPWPQAAKVMFRPACPWQQCLYLITHLRKLSSVIFSRKTRARGVIRELNKAWRRGLHSTRKLAMPISRNHPCNTATSTFPFHASPSTKTSLTASDAPLPRSGNPLPPVPPWTRLNPVALSNPRSSPSKGTCWMPYHGPRQQRGRSVQLVLGSNAYT